MLNESQWERSRRRWRKAPDRWRQLTWDVELPGEPFADKVAQYADFSAGKNILEVGPGYGRILKVCLERELPFASYCGLDLSEETCAYLRKNFPQENVRFLAGDVEHANFDTTFDIVMSSLTFKHLYPSCEPALANLARGASAGAVFCIDFVESQEPEALWHLETFIRRYTRGELLEILDRTGLEHVEFDEVRHDRHPWSWRLLLVARKPD
jgi:SAM-dependent methyltransferase